MCVIWFTNMTEFSRDLSAIDFYFNSIVINILLCVLVTQLCLTLCDPKDSILPGSSVCGILQARILEWVAIPSFRGSSRPKDGPQVSCIAGGFLII